jgi:hypothetical protein
MEKISAQPEMDYMNKDWLQRCATDQSEFARWRSSSDAKMWAWRHGFKSMSKFPTAYKSLAAWLMCSLSLSCSPPSPTSNHGARRSQRAHGLG